MEAVQRSQMESQLERSRRQDAESRHRQTEELYQGTARAVAASIDELTREASACLALPGTSAAAAAAAITTTAHAR
jgi:hypothetical protein